MNNIAAKLREVYWRAGWETDDGARVRRQREREEGADEIERLTAENMRLRAALERIADTDPDSGTQWFHDIARAALAAGLAQETRDE